MWFFGLCGFVSFFLVSLYSPVPFSRTPSALFLLSLLFYSYLLLLFCCFIFVVELRKVEWYGWYEDGEEKATKEEKKRTHHSRCGEKRRINNPPSSSISVLVFLDGLSTTPSFSYQQERPYFFPCHGATIQLQLLRLLLY